MFLDCDNCCSWRALIGRAGSLLQQKSSAAGCLLELWKNVMGDDLSVALAQYSMYPLIFLAVLLHDHQSCKLRKLKKLLILRKEHYIENLPNVKI